jgi:cell division protein FtsB
MKAVKGNKVYTVDEANKKAYLAQGYEIQDDKGKVLETPADKTVPYAEYKKLLDENAELKSENSKLKAENTKLKKVDKE